MFLKKVRIFRICDCIKSPSISVFKKEKDHKEFYLMLMLVDPCIIIQFIHKIQQDATVYQNFIIPYFYEAQDVSCDTPPIIRSLKLH